MYKKSQKESRVDDNRVFNINNFYINDKERRDRTRGSTAGSYGVIKINLFVISFQQKVYIRSCQLNGKFLSVKRKDVINLSKGK